MGLIDKIKDALFEVEYVEVDEPPKKEKENKRKDKKEKKDDSEKPIAKKIVLPGKRHEKVEELNEEELKDDNFEARPVGETLKEEKKEEFKIMNDNDFKVEEEFLTPEKPEIVEVIDNNDSVPKHAQIDYPIENLEESEPFTMPVVEEKVSYSEPVTNPPYRAPDRQSKPYGMDSSYGVPMHEYGGYEKKDEKNVFRPSPIISPIYGILDKNYKKEDVVQKREVRLSSYTRSNMSVDDIRNKAYGGDTDKNSDKEPKIIETVEDDGNLFVDLTDEKDKPEVKDVTMGDAMEYFQDLGLEYNVDYVDASNGKKEKPNNFEGLEEDIQKEIEKPDDKPIEVIQPKENKIPRLESDLPESDTPKEKKKEEKKSNVVEIKDEGTKKIDNLEDDDNLFDLIDSMYKEES